MFSSERDLNRLAPLTIVLATSKARIDILFSLAVVPEMNPLPAFKFDMLLPRVSITSMAFSSPARLALPKNELVSEAYMIEPKTNHQAL